MPRRPQKTRHVLIVTAGVLLLSIIAVYGLYSRDMKAIRDRLARESMIVETRHGPMEFTRWGDGPPVIVVHGAGGGYDQGRLIPKMFGSDGYEWISISRFGYLRSSLPEDPSTSAQAEAIADLLDKLGIDRAAIVAMSGGVPPSLQFAQLFPERTTALVLLSSAPFSPLKASQQDLPIPAWLYQALFNSDFLFWAVVKLAPSSLDRIFDVSPEARAQMSGPDSAFVEGLVEAFLPVTDRTAGLRNEVAAVDPGTDYDLEGITTPTLVVHARDDGINPFEFGEYTANNIPGSEFMALETGGHLLLGNIPEVRERVVSFLGLHAAEPAE